MQQRSISSRAHTGSHSKCLNDTISTFVNVETNVNLLRGIFFLSVAKCPMRMLLEIRNVPIKCDVRRDVTRRTGPGDHADG